MSPLAAPELHVGAMLDCNLETVDVKHSPAKVWGLERSKSDWDYRVLGIIGIKGYVLG